MLFREIIGNRRRDSVFKCDFYNILIVLFRPSRVTEYDWKWRKLRASDTRAISDSEYRRYCCNFHFRYWRSLSCQPSLKSNRLLPRNHVERFQSAVHFTHFFPGWIRCGEINNSVISPYWAHHYFKNTLTGTLHHFYIRKIFFLQLQFFYFIQLRNRNYYELHLFNKHLYLILNIYLKINKLLDLSQHSLVETITDRLHSIHWDKNY